MYEEIEISLVRVEQMMDVISEDDCQSPAYIPRLIGMGAGRIVCCSVY